MTLSLSPQVLASRREIVNDVEMPSLDEAIAYLETTPEESWWAGPTYRSPDDTQHCALAHVENRWSPETMAWFEGRWSTSYVIGAVNDGQHPGYQQRTVKERCLAYLYALRDGREEDTITSMDRHFRASL